MLYHHLHPGQLRLRALDRIPESIPEAPREWSNTEGPKMRRSDKEDRELTDTLKVNIPRKRTGKGDWRIMFGNINGFPLETNQGNDMKLDIWEKFYKQADAEVVGISEHKLNIPILARRDKPANIMRNWKESLVTRYSWLQNSDKGKYELGGTGITTSAMGTTHTIKEGSDNRRLGRWNWVTLQGKRDKKTTIISVYRPMQGQQTLQRQYA